MRETSSVGWLSRQAAPPSRMPRFISPEGRGDVRRTISWTPQWESARRMCPRLLLLHNVIHISNGDGRAVDVQSDGLVKSLSSRRHFKNPCKLSELRTLQCFNIESEARCGRRNSILSLRRARTYARQKNRRYQRALLSCHFCFCHVISTRTGISFFTAIPRRDGGSILKSDSVVGMVPVIRVSFPWVTCWNDT